MNPDSPHFNENLIADLKEIMADDFELLVATFISDSKSRCSELTAILNSHEAGEFGRACHSLKGSATNVGAVRLAELCWQGEMKGADQDLSDATGLLQEIASELTLVANILQDRAKI